MRHAKKELTEKIESGEYFSEAKDWYVNTYIYRFVERTYLLLLLAGFMFLLYFTYSYFVEITPIKKSLPIRVEISDAANEYTKLSYLGSKSKDFNINKVLITYFSARFLEAIESYDYRRDFKKLKKNTNIIEKLGTQGIQNFYQEKISIRNPESFVLKYRKNVIRDVFIDQSKIEIAEVDQLDTDYDKEYIVTIRYDIREIHNKQDVIKTSWVAELSLNFETIHYDFNEKTFNDLNFKVKQYESRKVK